MPVSRLKRSKTAGARPQLMSRGTRSGTSRFMAVTTRSRDVMLMARMVVRGTRSRVKERRRRDTRPAACYSPARAGTQDSRSPAGPVTHCSSPPTPSSRPTSSSTSARGASARRASGCCSAASSWPASPAPSSSPCSPTGCSATGASSRSRSIGSIAFFLLLHATRSFAAAMPLVIGLGFCYRSAIPLTDALFGRVLDDPSRQYGLIRVAGSAGFIAVSLVLQLTGWVSGTRPASILVAFAAARGSRGARRGDSARRAEDLAGSPAAPRPSAAARGSATAARRLAAGFDARFWTVIAVLFLARFGISAHYSFFSLFLRDSLGLANVSGIWALGALAEVPMILFSGWIIARFGVRADPDRRGRGRHRTPGAVRALPHPRGRGARAAPARLHLRRAAHRLGGVRQCEDRSPPAGASAWPCTTP